MIRLVHCPIYSLTPYTRVGSVERLQMQLQKRSIPHSVKHRTTQISRRFIYDPAFFLNLGLFQTSRLHRLQQRQHKGVVRIHPLPVAWTGCTAIYMCKQCRGKPVGIVIEGLQLVDAVVQLSERCRFSQLPESE